MVSVRVLEYFLVVHIYDKCTKNALSGYREYTKFAMPVNTSKLAKPFSLLIFYTRPCIGSLPMPLQEASKIVVSDYKFKEA